MQTENTRNLIDLIFEAKLNLMLWDGDGFGAVLLAVIALALIWKVRFRPVSLTRLLEVIRKSK